MAIEQEDQSTIELLFPTPVYICRHLDSAALNDELSKVVQAMETEDPVNMEVHEDHYVNGYTSYFSYDSLMTDNRFGALTAFITGELNKFGREFGYDMIKYRLSITKMWANIQYERGTHANHIHRDSVFSGVYYLKAPPQSSMIKFHDPKLVARMAEMKVSEVNFLNHVQALFEAKEGNVVIFPAYLFHEVTPHKSSEPRISVSFNSKLFRN